MANSLLDLAESHVLSGDCDSHVSRQFLHSLDQFQALRGKNEKQLKGYTTLVNTCLQSPAGQHVGLHGLSLLVQQCPEEYFLQHAKGWLDLVLGIAKNAVDRHKRLSEVLIKLFQRGETCTELVRHVSTISGTVVQLLTGWIKQGHGPVASRTLKVFLSTFPRSCGQSATSLEKFLLDNFRPDGAFSTTSLARCFALLPFLGGGGKEGIQYRQKWTAMASDLTSTMSCLISDLLSALDKERATVPKSVPMKIPTSSTNNLLTKTLFLSDQIEKLAFCLREMLKVPFLHCKSLNLSCLFDACLQVIQYPIGPLLQDPSLDVQMLTSSLPSVYKAIVGLVEDVVLIAKDDCLMFVPALTTAIISILGGVRNIGNDYETSRFAVQDLKRAVFSLLGQLARTLGCSSGLHISAKEVLPLLLKEVVPFQQSLNLAPKKKHQKNGKNANTEPSRTSRLSSPPKVSAAALRALADIFGSCGALMSEQIHRDVEPIVLSLALEMQQNSSAIPPFNYGPCRKHLYQFLSALMTNPSAHCPSSLHFASVIFSRGKVSEVDPTVVEVCRDAALTLENILHPRAPTFNPDMLVNRGDLAVVREAVMKVHVAVLGGGSYGGPAAARKRSDMEISSRDLESSKRPRFTEVETLAGTNQVVMEDQVVEDEGDAEAFANLLDKRKAAQEAERNGKVGAADQMDVDVSEEDKKKAMELFYDFSNQSVFIPEDVRNASLASKKKIVPITEGVVDSKEPIDLAAVKSMFVPEDSDDE